MIANLMSGDAVVPQSAAGECGLACLATIARHHGARGDLASLRRLFPISSRGASLRDLVTIADQMGFHTRALKSDIASLSQMALPAILHWDLNHYVVLSKVRQGAKGVRYTVLDPATGVRTLLAEELAEHFTGIVLELLPTAKFTPQKALPRLRLSQLWTRMSGVGPALVRILVLSVLMQLVVLVLPLHMQLAIDTALPAMDVDLLNVLVVGFCMLILLNTAMLWVRARLILSLSYSLGFQTAINLFRHTIYLPLAWFEKRHLGDVVSRFGSLQ
ncbi:MAG: cysteine peptidase family C39 domain-containing protein, partial [Lysobacter sp.]